MRLLTLACAAAIISACARAHSGSQPGPGSEAATPAVRDVHEILGGVATVGATVAVRGTCIRMDEKAASGPAPLTRSDWQMRDVARSDQAIWVVGERPADCGYDKGSAGPVTILAVVARDTVPQVSGSGVARWYLRRATGD